MANKATLLSITFSGCANTDIIYEGNFEQSVIVDAFFDSPQIDTEEEINIKGDGSQETKFRKVTERCVFEVCDLVDTQLYGFHQIASHKNIEIKNLVTQESFEAEAFRFSHRESGDCTYVGRISYEAKRSIATGCCNSKQVTTVCL